MAIHVLPSYALQRAVTVGVPQRRHKSVADPQPHNLRQTDEDVDDVPALPRLRRLHNFLPDRLKTNLQLHQVFLCAQLGAYHTHNGADLRVY